MRIRKKLLSLVVMTILLAGVGYALADSSQGNVTVTPEIPRVTNISFPLSAAPGVPNTLTFSIEYLQGVETLVSERLFIDIYSNGVVPHLPWNQFEPTTISLFNHYRLIWEDGAGDVTHADWPSGIFSNFDVTPDGPTSGGVIEFSVDVRIDELADATLIIIFHFEISWLNPWTVKLTYSSEQFLAPAIQETYEFDLTAFLGLNIIQSSFSMGSIEQGQQLIPISIPSQGFLNLSAMSNSAYEIQVRGTNPTFDSEFFDVSNILQNSINDPATAIPLTLSEISIANLGIQSLTLPGEEDHFVLYLWISIPTSAIVGTYTFILTVTIIGM